MIENKKSKKKKLKRSSGSYPEEHYNKKLSDLYLDREFHVLPNASMRKNGKDVPVNVQIANYLKDMMMLERNKKNLSRDNLRKIIVEEIEEIILESKIRKRRFNGRVYKTTDNIVKLVESERVSVGITLHSYDFDTKNTTNIISLTLPPSCLTTRK